MSWLKGGFLLVLLLAGGCGYHPMSQPGSLPDGLQTMHIGLFGNRTTEAFLENAVTEAVIERFSRQRGLNLVESPARADALLSGSLVSYGLAASAFNRLDQITEYRVSLTVEAELRRRSDGKLLWKGSLERSEEFPGSADKAAQEDNESAAAQLAIDRLAEELHYRTLANF